MGREATDQNARGRVDEATTDEGRGGERRPWSEIDAAQHRAKKSVDVNTRDG
jgi:hypothetical protein